MVSVAYCKSEQLRCRFLVLGESSCHVENELISAVLLIISFAYFVIELSGMYPVGVGDVCVIDRDSLLLMTCSDVLLVLSILIIISYSY